MKCPVVDPGFAKSPIHGLEAQRRLVRDVLRYCKGRRRALDVGAHIGTWTVSLAPHFAAVEAWEPQPDNYECLKANTKELGNVVASRFAVGREHRRCRIQNVGANSGCGFAVEGGDHLMVPLDEYHFDDVDFIKIDVEGLEGDVLLGAVQILARSKPVVFFEDNGLGAVHYGPSWMDPKTVLSAAGYKHRARIAKNEIWTCA